MGHKSTSTRKPDRLQASNDDEAHPVDESKSVQLNVTVRSRAHEPHQTNLFLSSIMENNDVKFIIIISERRKSLMD